MALSLCAIAPITLRVNPDVDAKTHAKIATGKSENKFGIPIAKSQEVYALAASMEGIEVVGIDVHIGSQLTDLEPFRLAYEKVAELTKTLRQDGHNIRRLDLGGGLGIPYENSNQSPPTPEDYAKVIHETVGNLDCEIEIEPGRLLAGNAGLMISSVIYNKSGEGRDFMIVDAAMNDLIRPAMYEAYHEIIPVLEPNALCITAAKASDSCEETGTLSAVQGTGIAEAGAKAGGEAGAGAAQSLVRQVTVKFSVLQSLRQQTFGLDHPLHDDAQAWWDFHGPTHRADLPPWVAFYCASVQQSAREF